MKAAMKAAMKVAMKISRVKGVPTSQAESLRAGLS